MSAHRSFLLLALAGVFMAAAFVFGFAAVDILSRPEDVQGAHLIGRLLAFAAPLCGLLAVLLALQPKD